MGGGSGLGLAIARKLVELHKGRIWAESRLGEGTTCYAALPYHHDGTAAPGGPGDHRGEP